jgi:hypothetical protein
MCQSGSDRLACDVTSCLGPEPGTAASTGIYYATKS